ncbi:MAG: aminotransferase class IV [Pseudomonadota bacterium]
MNQPSVDPRNQNIQVMINGKLYPRSEAKVSVFDSVVQGGDAVWEGLRVYDQRIAALEAHIRRLRDSAHALAFTEIPTYDAVVEDVFATLTANGMEDGAHIRLTLTRGEKVTSGMNPRFNQSGPTLIVLAEWKQPVYNETGIRLVTASIRRNTPQCLDSKIHHNNLLNNILASIEANVANVDSAVMLDVGGFIAETNDTNLFLIRDRVLHTPHATACLPGITRGMIIELAKEHGIDCVERDISLTELYTADEAFTTGTMGELTPVIEVDGRRIGEGVRGTMTERLQQIHRSHAWHTGTPIQPVRK